MLIFSLDLCRVKVSREIAQFSPSRTRTYATRSCGSNGPHYLNVRHRELGTIIIQTVRILQHDGEVTDSLPEEEFVHGHSNLLSNDLARQ
jgi:hypothetical protein